MRYQTLQQAINEIVSAHKADLTFFTGLESDFDPANNVHYPAIVFTPPAFTMPFPDGTVGMDTWTLHIESQEQLSDSSTTAQKQEALDRTREYLRDIVLEFVYNYGYENKAVSYGNITENLDFVVTEVAAFSPFIDINDGITGWQVDLTIQEGDYDTLCHLSDIFS